MLHIVDKVLPCEDSCYPPILVKVFYKAETCEVLLGKEYTEEDGKMKDVSDRYQAMFVDHPELKLEMEQLRQNMVCQAEGHCDCHCPNRN